jgi:hypothetical protein
MTAAGSSDVSSITRSEAGRAVNAGEPNWPASLRGEAAEIYVRWQRDPKPHVFRLDAPGSRISGRHAGRHRTLPKLGAIDPPELIDLDQFRAADKLI